MPLLLYCVAPESAAETSVHGVGRAVVQSSVEGGLRFFYSETAEINSKREIVTAAQEVHAVISDIFAQSAVLPFRYPTIVAGEEDIAQLAKERGAAFHEYLEHTRPMVQMDVRLTIREDPHDLPTPGGTVGQPLAWTGRAYLKERARCQALLSVAAETCRQAAHSTNWRMLERGENIHCQALISRVEVLSFLERMRTLGLPAGVRVAVSGPWPPAGFWEDEPR